MATQPTYIPTSCAIIPNCVRRQRRTTLRLQWISQCWMTFVRQSFLFRRQGHLALQIPLPRLFVRTFGLTVWWKMKVFAECWKYWSQDTKSRVKVFYRNGSSSSVHTDQRKGRECTRICCESCPHLQTSRGTESYVTITVHFIDDTWEMNAYVLQTRAMHDSHTGAHMAEVLQGASGEWSLTEKDPVVVTDNATNMILAVELTGFQHIRCFAYWTLHHSSL